MPRFKASDKPREMQGGGKAPAVLTVALAEGGVGRAARAGERQHALHVDGKTSVLGAGEGAEAAHSDGVGHGGLDLPAALGGRLARGAPLLDVVEAVQQIRGLGDAVHRRRRGRGVGVGARPRSGGGERQEDARHGGGGGGTGGEGHGSSGRS